MEPIYVWLMSLVVFVVIEIATMGLTTIWFAGGSLIALLLAVFETSFYMQLGVFLIVSIALLVVTRPLALKYFNKSVEKTNAEGLIGKQALKSLLKDLLGAKGCRGDFGNGQIGTQVGIHVGKCRLGLLGIA